MAQRQWRRSARGQQATEKVVQSAGVTIFWTQSGSAILEAHVTRWTGGMPKSWEQEAYRSDAPGVPRNPEEALVELIGALRAAHELHNR